MPLTNRVTDWIDKELADDPDFARDVDAELQAMRVEQELVALRQARGVSQRQLARMLGVTQPVIARIESGRSQNVGLQTIVRVARALGGRVQVRITPATDERPVMARAAVRSAKGITGTRRTSRRR